MRACNVREVLPLPSVTAVMSVGGAAPAHNREPQTVVKAASEERL
jgi:hypothetical protein